MPQAKLGRTSSQRRALFRSMVTALFAAEKIETTQAKAREVRSIAEKMITKARSGELHARRQALGYLYDEDVVTKLFEVIAPRYEGRPGGYTRIVKIGPRRGDAAPMAILELV